MEFDTLYKARQKFCQEFCSTKGWDINNLSLNQIIEIRKQQKWKHPEKE
jgi:hypothetical protein